MTVPSLAGLAAYPLVGLKEAFQNNSDDFYEKTLKAKKKKSQEEDALQCQREGLPLTPAMTEILKSLNINNCVGCKPLGKPTCQDESCDCSTICPDWCQRVCPENAEILIQSREMAIPFKENNLDVINTKADFGNVGLFGGYCNGITTFTKRMSALAQFKPNEKPKDSNGKEISDPDKISEFYENKLREINNGKVTSIPGFSGIYDFSKQPHLQPLIRNAIRISWQESNFYNPFLVESWGVVSAISDEDFNQELTDINKMIKMSGSAQVTLSQNDITGKGKGHTVEIYHTFEETLNNEVYTNACINDSNETRSKYLSKEQWLKDGKSDTTPDGIYCPNLIVLKVTKEGKITSKRNIIVDEMDKRDTANHIEVLSQHCKQERKCED